MYTYLVRFIFEHGCIFVHRSRSCGIILALGTHYLKLFSEFELERRRESAEEILGPIYAFSTASATSRFALIRRELH